MSGPTTLDLIAGLASQRGRAEAAARLSAHLGVQTTLLFAQDPVLRTLVPVPGMPQTVNGGPAWRAFLKRCASAGRHVGEVDVPPHTLRRAQACSTDGMTLIVIGGECTDAELDLLCRMLPLLDAMLGAEQRVVGAAAEASEAREAAHRASALANALEAARADAARLNAELREEDRHKNEFLAMLAHELRNPLAPLVNAIAVLRRTSPVGEQNARLIDLMARQTGQLTRLIDDLMDVSRVSQGRIELRLQPIELRDVMTHAAEASHQAFEGKGHRLLVAAPEEGLVVHGDATRLTQVFSNLLHNAAKYTDPGGEVRMTARRDGAHAVIEVADTGIGIDAAMLSRIFDLFAQVPVAIDRSQGGLGIGLTLVRKLVELHEGTIVARSPGRGQGSTFIARIPLARPVPSPAGRGSG